jgi:ribonuclease M5
MKDEKKKVTLPIIVEGKYDKITIDSHFDARVFACDGFVIFNSEDKRKILRKIAANGVILLLDSDGGGVQIRSYLNSMLPKEKIHNLYIPKLPGKERRKKHASRAGTLGVEGMSGEVLLRVLAPFIEDGGRVEKNEPDVSQTERRMLTKVDFYLDGLSGGENSSEKRARLAEYFDLPSDITAGALLEVLNMITDYDGYRAAVDAIKNA